MTFSRMSGPSRAVLNSLPPGAHDFELQHEHQHYCYTISVLKIEHESERRHRSSRVASYPCPISSRACSCAWTTLGFRSLSLQLMYISSDLTVIDGIEDRSIMAGCLMKS